MDKWMRNMERGACWGKVVRGRKKRVYIIRLRKRIDARTEQRENYGLRTIAERVLSPARVHHI